ncbi:MAG: hypothetical protein AMXMBFR84_33590 [Candidatus Hydrogenedentota bacterium]
MAYEGAQIAKWQAGLVSASHQNLLVRELSKGCTPDIAPVPVELEPPYTNFSSGQRSVRFETEAPYLPAAKPCPEDLVRYRIYVAPSTDMDWRASEDFIKQLVACAHPIVFEVWGNRDEIVMSFICHRQDEGMLNVAFQGAFPSFCLAPGSGPEKHLAECARLEMLEVFPEPPLTHLFTRPMELVRPPVGFFINTLCSLDSSTIGLYQVLFKPVDRRNNWHRFINLFLDLEYRASTLSGAGPASRYAQQLPSAELRGMAMDTDQKAHNDRAILAAVPRVLLLHKGLANTSPDVCAASCFLYRIQHGGRPLCGVTEADFLRAHSLEAVKEMIELGITYRPGFILNSQELTSFVHLPPVSETPAAPPIKVLDGLPPLTVEDSATMLIGHRLWAGREEPVFLSEDILLSHGHLMGGTGKGKSTVLENMAAHDIVHGRGIAVIDPHGDLSARILGLIPPSEHHRVVYFAPGDPDWVTIWNPIDLPPGQDGSRLADELVMVFEAISDGFGDRLGNLLRQTISGLIRLGNSTLLDVEMALSSKGQSRKRLIQRVLPHITNPVTEHFWRELLSTSYSKSDMQPVHNKIGKLFSSDSVALMLSQPKNTIDFRKIMDSGDIFVANLSGLSPDQQAILGRIVLTMTFASAVGRSSIEISQRRPFTVYADEAYIFVARSLQSTLNQARKYGVSLILAHQNLAQWEREQIAALKQVDFTLLFGMSNTDAKDMVNSLGGNINPSVIARLARGDAVIRLRNDWARLKTLPERKDFSSTLRDQAIAESRKKYCAPFNELVQQWKIRRKVWVDMRPPRADTSTPEDYQFDRLRAPKED